MGVVNGYDVSVFKKLGDDGEYCMFRIVPPKHTSFYAFNITITKWPTGNCQLASIGSMNCLFVHTNYKKEDILAILKHCYSLIDLAPKLAIMDVHQSYCQHLENCFNNIRNKHPYTSTNSSPMCLYLVQMD